MTPNEQIPPGTVALMVCPRAAPDCNCDHRTAHELFGGCSGICSIHWGVLPCTQIGFRVLDPENFKY